MRKALVILVSCGLLLAGCRAAPVKKPTPTKAAPTRAAAATAQLAADTATPEPAGAPLVTRLPAPEPAATPAPPASATEQRARTTVKSNLRSGPGTNYAVVGTVNAGQGLDIVACNQGRTWYQLAGGQWIFADLVENAPSVQIAAVIPAPPTNTSAPARPAATRAPTKAPTRAPTARPTAMPAGALPPVVVGGTCKVTEGTINVRTGPGTKYDARIFVAKGTVLTILGKNDAGTWLNVRTPFKVEGWVYAPYCR